MTKITAVDILVYHGKHGDQYYLVDTPERLEAVKRKLFSYLDGCGYYSSGDADFDLAAARGGDIRYISCILDRRRNYEYEGWSVEPAEIVE